MVRRAVVAIALVVAVAIPFATRAPAGAPPGTAARPAKPARRSASTASSSNTGHITTPGDAKDAPAYRYAQLSTDACLAALADRGIGFAREQATAVVAPVRLTGALHGVVFRTDQSAKVRATSPYEIIDCRLVLALDDFAEILQRHGIVEVRHYSIYRPPRSWPDDKPGAQHAGALAIDAGRFIDGAGAVLDVDHDFHGAIGAKTCGDGAAPHPATANALALREILCEAVDRRLFTVVLTPNYNRPHHNHFHLELTAGVAWFLVH